MNLLFVTWDGPRLPYLETLFLPIFKRLGDAGVRAHVLQFGWSDAEEVERIARRCADDGVAYRHASVWRRPVSIGSIATAIAGRSIVADLVRSWAIDVVMPRSYLPAVAALPAARAQGSATLLDADGLPNDERVDFAGLSDRSAIYWLLAAIERWAVRRADSVIVRTPAAADLLVDRAKLPSTGKFTVVANARDEDLFCPATTEQRHTVRARLGIPDDAPLAIFVGSSVSGKYDGKGLMAFIDHLRRRRSDSRLLIVTPDEQEAIALCTAAGPDACLVRSARPEEVPVLIGAADVGLSLIRPSPSMRGASAIKTGEYLLCGIPVVATAGVGGIERILTPETGVVIRHGDDDALAASASWVANNAGHRPSGQQAACRALGIAHFGMNASIDRYRLAIEMALKAHVRD